MVISKIGVKAMVITTAAMCQLMSQKFGSDICFQKYCLVIGTIVTNQILHDFI